MIVYTQTNSIRVSVGGMVLYASTKKEADALIASAKLMGYNAKRVGHVRRK